MLQSGRGAREAPETDSLFNFRSPAGKPAIRAPSFINRRPRPLYFTLLSRCPARDQSPGGFTGQSPGRFPFTGRNRGVAFVMPVGGSTIAAGKEKADQCAYAEGDAN
jgi:hypothetical protein